jgi:hypothetical protein
MLKKGLIILFAFLLAACEGPIGTNGKDGVDGKDGDYDKQIRLEFTTISAYDTREWTITPGYMHITNFNKSYYNGVDSIIFCASIHHHGDITDTDTMYIDLYNITDNVEISNTILSSTNYYKVSNWVHTVNIYNSLPDKEIELAIRTKMNKTKTMIVDAVLFLYRK